MPNLDAPNGFTPDSHLHGGTVRYNGGYSIASGYTSDIFLGDVVKLPATKAGNNIEVAAAGDLELVGVFAGCQYTDANGDVRWEKQWRANTVTENAAAAEAFVYTDPNILFAVQVNGSLSGVDAIGEFADLDATQAGNAATGISGMQLSATSAATAANFRIVGLAKQPEGIFNADISSANPRVLVQFSEHVQISNIL